MSKKLTWLHISDIHFHPKTEWRDGASRTELLNHLRDIFAGDESLRPDFIFCTGDIAFGESSSSSLSDQYAQAKTFFDDLLLICGKKEVSLPKERLWVVPGNHDVNRRCINTDAQSTLTLWAKNPQDHIEVINQRFEDRNKEFKDTINRLDDYAQFVKDYLPHQHDEDGRHHYVTILDFQGLKLGIAGFNSAWTCAGLEDDRNIWLAANWQFNAAHRVLKDADICIGLMHHPVDWLNSADRDTAQHRLASDYHFWLHGHSHNAWITPIQSHIVIAAGAVGTQSSDEFGINLTSIDLASQNGVAHLHSKKSGSNGWIVSPVEHHAPEGQWAFELPTGLRKGTCGISPITNGTKPVVLNSARQIQSDTLIDRHLTERLDQALQAFSSQPRVWITPTLRTKSEIAQDAKSSTKVDISDFIANPKSSIIKAPPQYGQTCLAHFMVKEAWRSPVKALWLYLDTRELKPHAASINEAVLNESKALGCSEQDFKCVILDSWSSNEKDAHKLLRKLSGRFKDLPIVCMQQVDIGLFDQIDPSELDRQFEVLYLWALSRTEIRKIVSAYNEVKFIGDEDAVTTRIVSDLGVLNLHRTAFNCLTLLKVSEIDFDESPINRSEMIKRVLFLLFNVDDIPTYKSRPDLKDCEYVLGYFCEQLIRERTYSFTRERFLNEIHKCCQDSFIDLETHVVFDVLYANNILIKRGSFFYFKFAYWIFYFLAQRMHHSQDFAGYIFEEMRYAQHPEIIEFYTGIDRKREDALQILILDIQKCRESVSSKCGLPEDWNPFRYAAWNPSPAMEAQMQKVIVDGVRESSLPAAIKDQYADRAYDQTRPYDQSIPHFLSGHTLLALMQIIRAGARALRNSDYVSPSVKHQLLGEILKCWEQVTKILLIILPILAKDGHAQYDGSGFVVIGDLEDTPQKRFMQILTEIPSNVVAWNQDDLFSRKMGPLLMRQLDSDQLSDISRHELILLLIQQKPRDWSKHVQRYIASITKNSFYLYDVYVKLRNDYRYCFASAHTLKDMEHLIKLAAAKHATGDKVPNTKTIDSITKANEDLIPPREILG